MYDNVKFKMVFFRLCFFFSSNFAEGTKFIINFEGWGGEGVGGMKNSLNWKPEFLNSNEIIAVKCMTHPYSWFASINFQKIRRKKMLKITYAVL